MLSTDTRTVAAALLKPPPGYTLDLALITSYSLDLEALLAIYFATFSDAEQRVEELLGDSALLLAALSRARERVHVFVDRQRIAIPGAPREIYSLVENSVHPVTAPNGGAFHPKLWVARFRGAESDVRLRVAVLSRNLTFDRSWDLALASESAPRGQRRVRASSEVATLVRALPGLAKEQIPADLRSLLEDLAGQLERTAFPSPPPFEDPINFRCLGLEAGKRRLWQPVPAAKRVFAVAPFANRAALDGIADATAGERVLVSTQEELDKLPDDARAKWTSIYVLAESAAGEPEDGRSIVQSPLHAKLLGFEHGAEATWFVGSANLTRAAFAGNNVEVIAAITGAARSKRDREGAGIDSFSEGGFLGLCIPYRPQPVEVEDAAAVAARDRVERAAAAMAAAGLRGSCTEDGAHWSYGLVGDCVLPEGVEVAAWPITVQEAAAQPLSPVPHWRLPKAKLTEFVAFRIRATDSDVEAARFTLKLAVEGMPDGRDAAVFRMVIDSPEKLLAFLHSLLGEGELDAPCAYDQTAFGAGRGSAAWAQGDALLEKLVRTAARDPNRLTAFRQAMVRFTGGPEQQSFIPEDLRLLLAAVDEAVGGRDAS